MYYKPHDDICSSQCFHERFWLEHKEAYLNGKPYIIIDGHLYLDDGNVKNPRDTRMLGHSGRVFHIRMYDSREIETNNLWYIGEIPESYRNVLANNAEFVKENIHGQHTEDAMVHYLF